MTGNDPDGFEVEVRFGIDVAMNLLGVDLIDANGGSLGRLLYFSGRDLNFTRRVPQELRVLVRSSGPSLLRPRSCGFARDGTTSAL
jgi:hypothetical protein